jgi:hypothetical protein
MDVVEAALWGLFGVAALEGLDFANTARASGTWPWKAGAGFGVGPYLFSILIRAGIAGGFTAAAVNADQINTAIGAIAIGIASPLVLQQMARQATANSDRPPGATTAARATAPDKASVVSQPDGDDRG